MLCSCYSSLVTPACTEYIALRPRTDCALPRELLSSKSPLDLAPPLAHGPFALLCPWENAVFIIVVRTSTSSSSLLRQRIAGSTPGTILNPHCPVIRHYGTPYRSQLKAEGHCYAALWPDVQMNSCPTHVMFIDTSSKNLKVTQVDNGRKNNLCPTGPLCSYSTTDASIRSPGQDGTFSLAAVRFGH